MLYLELLLRIETILHCIHRHSTKIEVLELLKAAGDVLRLTVVAGGLSPTAQDYSAIESRRGHRGRAKQHHGVSQHRMEVRYEKARLFHNKVRM